MDSPIIPSFPNEPVSIDNSKTISFVLSVSPSEKLKGASTLGSDINEQERRYRTVKAITLHWHGEKFDSDPYGPAREAAELLAALSKWGWQTEDYYIMADDPAEKTAKFLTDCTRASQSDELLVVYYVGHGRESSKEPTPQPFGVARQGSSPSDDASIDWPVIRSVLEAAQCDVVMFLNCCHGADAWVSRNLEEDGFKGPPGKVMVCLTVHDLSMRKSVANATSLEYPFCYY
ncbi:hypothetical protein F4813DRAFT_333324 [Daldinia decipiens]|uniref:uncharacterized protein n=1 Tax=Daldinia decipiens TaxID=326647 RepID=UPI0020C2F9B6|nr:uncharacterized protein F4813DRAFT_333324 [Daldinia decipiens]KAI1659426.1 hypothetical protein F4813DRAFT_333324 [Daldinia decipiens]